MFKLISEQISEFRYNYIFKKKEKIKKKKNQAIVYKIFHFEKKIEMKIFISFNNIKIKLERYKLHTNLS